MKYTGRLKVERLAIFQYHFFLSFAQNINYGQNKYLKHKVEKNCKFLSEMCQP